MLEACKTADLPEPKFRSERTGLWVEFRFSAPAESRLVAEKSSVKSSVKIVELMRNTPKITIPEIATQLGKTTRAIEKQVRQLKEDKVIGRVGPDKGGYWEVLK